MKDSFEVEGVVEDLAHSLFKVRVNSTNTIVTCTLSGKLRQNNIHILRGDKVNVDISVDDVTKGRITWRFK